LTQEQVQHEFDLDWQRLVSNEPGAVMEALAGALEADGAAAPIAVEADEASLVVLTPDDSAVPERMPGTTAAGNLSLRKTTRAERRSVHTALVAGLVIRSLRQALAAAPGIERVRVVVLRDNGTDAYGRPRLTCILAGLWNRPDLDAVHWDEATAGTILLETHRELIFNYQSSGLEELDLTHEPELAALVASADVTSLRHRDQH
jgi:hypothetical protein